MEPVLLSFYAPAHPLDVVAQNVVCGGFPGQLSGWKQRSGATELVYAATCQRVIWLQWGGDPGRLGLDPGVARLEGPAVWRHLLSVAAGLESANMGDREVPGQLLSAVEDARRLGVAGPEAHAALSDVIREAHRLRSRIGLADGSVSVATAALRHLEASLNPGDSVAIVGVGPMSAYLAERLPERGFRVTVVNRTLSKADDLAKPLGLDVLPLPHLQQDPSGFQAIVTATSSPVPLFTTDRWKSSPGAHLHLLDLALPPDSDPGLSALPWVKRVDLPAFLAETETGRTHRLEAAKAAAPLLDAAVARLQKRAQERARKHDLGEARHRLESAWQALEAEALADLDPAQQAHLADLLKRGRTLAHRALAQSDAAVNPFFGQALGTFKQVESDVLDAGVPWE